MFDKLLLFLIKTQVASAASDPFTGGSTGSSGSGGSTGSWSYEEPAGTLYSPGGGVVDTTYGGGVDFTNPLGVFTWQQLLDRIIKGLIILATPIAVIMVLWAAYLYITSGGDTNKIAQAHKTILWVAIGYGVLLLASGIGYLVQSLLLGY